MESELQTTAYSYLQRFKPLELIRVYATQQAIRHCTERFPSGKPDDIQQAVVAAWRQHIERNGPQQDRERQRLSQILLAPATQNTTMHLSGREQEVLILRFGLHNCRIHSLADIGQMFQITRERVRQIEENALRKLKKYHEI